MKDLALCRRDSTELPKNDYASQKVKVERNPIHGGRGRVNRFSLADVTANVATRRDQVGSRVM